MKTELEAVGGVLYEQYGSVSSDGSVRLEIVNQPESQHRARYQTEGSRGAIKDRAGTGHPVLKLEGYAGSVVVEMYIGNDAGKVVPHMFYQACKVTGKNSFPCNEKKVEGTDVIEVSLEPGLEKILVCDCVGILKERFADVEARFPKQKNWKTSKKKSTKCRLIMRAPIINKDGKKEVLQVASGVINCTQLPGTPEILRMSTTTSDVVGGGEVWMIGKNFLKDTTVVFSYSVAGKKEPLWIKYCEPEKEFIHQSHLITLIPPFFDLKVEEEVEVSLLIKCGDKISDSHPFTYTPLAKKAGEVVTGISVSTAANPSSEQFNRTSLISVIKPSETPENKPTPMVLENLYNHKMKKSRLDYNGRSATRRTRSVPRLKSIPRLILVNEDTNLVSDINPRKNQVVYKNFSETSISPWKGVRKVSPAAGETVSPPEPPRVYDTSFTKRSYSIEEDDSQNNSLFHKDLMFHEEISDTSRSDFSSSLTSDFSAVFSGGHKTETLTTFPSNQTSTTYPPQTNSASYQPLTNSNIFPPITNSSSFKPPQSSSAYPPPSNAPAYQPLPNTSETYPPPTAPSSYPPPIAPSTYQPPSNPPSYQPPSKTYSPPSNSTISYKPPLNSTTYQPSSNTSAYTAPSDQSTYQPPSNSIAYPSPSNSTTYQPSTNSTSYQTPSNSTTYPPPSNSAFNPNSNTTTVEPPTTTYPTPSDTTYPTPSDTVSPSFNQSSSYNSQYNLKYPTPWRQENTLDLSRGGDQGVSPGFEKKVSSQSSSVLSVSASDDDKATISISLPTSILKDKKHFQSVIETINNTLLKNQGGDDKAEEQELPQPSFQAKASITSVPISVLHMNRKRNFSNEVEVEAYVPVENSKEERRENKWNEEFNDALKTVVEENIAEEAMKNSMDWDEVEKTKTSEKFQMNSMEWSANAAQPLENTSFYAAKPPVKLSEVESALGIHSYSTQETASPPSNSTSDLPTTSVKGKIQEATPQYQYQPENIDKTQFSYSAQPASKQYPPTAMVQEQQYIPVQPNQQYITVELQEEATTKTHPYVAPSSGLDSAEQQYMQKVDKLEQQYVLEQRKEQFDAIPIRREEQPYSVNQSTGEQQFILSKNIQQQQFTATKVQNDQYLISVTNLSDQHYVTNTGNPTQPKYVSEQQYTSSKPSAEPTNQLNNTKDASEPQYATLAVNPTEPHQYASAKSIQSEQKYENGTYTSPETVTGEERWNTVSYSPQEQNYSSVKIVESEQQYAAAPAPHKLAQAKFDSEHGQFSPPAKIVGSEQQYVAATGIAGQLFGQPEQQYLSEQVTHSEEQYASPKAFSTEQVEPKYINSPLLQTEIPYSDPRSTGGNESQCETSSETRAVQGMQFEQTFSTQEAAQPFSSTDVQPYPSQVSAQPFPVRTSFASHESSVQGSSQSFSNQETSSYSPPSSDKTFAKQINTQQFSIQGGAAQNFSTNETQPQGAEQSFSSQELTQSFAQGTTQELSQSYTQGAAQTFKSSQPYSADFEFKMKGEDTYSQSFGQEPMVGTGSKSVVPMDYEISAPATYAKPPNDLEIYEQAAQIQGDPLLSETSAVIDLQKGIENAQVDDKYADPGILGTEEWTSGSSKWE